MSRFLITWAFNVLALWAATALVHGVYSTGDEAVTLIVAGLVFSIVNRLVKPVVTLLSIPLIIVTLGVALFFVNLLMLFLTAWVVGPFHIDGFWAGVAATLIVWAVNALLEAVRERLERNRAS
jgi:putative membrane protein